MVFIVMSHPQSGDCTEMVKVFLKFLKFQSISFLCHAWSFCHFFYNSSSSAMTFRVMILLMQSAGRKS
jgi:hypothetical protein